MPARTRPAPEKRCSAAGRRVPQRKDFTQVFEEIMKVAPVPVSPIERECTREGDTFREFTLYDDEHAVVTTTSVMF